MIGSIRPLVACLLLVGGALALGQEEPRPHLVFMIGEREYDTGASLTEFARSELEKAYRVTALHAKDGEGDFPGLVEALSGADLLLVSVRRRALPEGQMKALRKFVAAGKPVMGIRTASHAFSLRGKKPPEGAVVWEGWDQEVFGGNYSGHHGNNLKSVAKVVGESALTTGVGDFPTGGSLYKVSPLGKGAKTLLRGSAKGVKDEPLAWTFLRKDGGRSFYTSLGHVDDFKREEFRRLLLNGIVWGLGDAAGSED